MSMYAFWEMFPEVASTETRVITILPGHALPPDEYTFLELYCTHPRCDCRRVMVFAVSSAKECTVATINHAFEPENADDLMGQTFLELSGDQSEISGQLLALFLDVLHRDPAYHARLKRHYHLVKDALRNPRHPVHQKLPPGATDDPPLSWPTDKLRAARKPGRNAACPCGSGKKFKHCRCTLTVH